MPEYMVITREDWEAANEKQRGWMMFNTVQDMNKRLIKIEKRSFLYKTFAFAGGMVGGACAFFGIKVFH